MLDSLDNFYRFSGIVDRRGLSDHTSNDGKGHGQQRLRLGGLGEIYLDLTIFAGSTASTRSTDVRHIRKGRKLRIKQ